MQSADKVSQFFSISPKRQLALESGLMIFSHMQGEKGEGDVSHTLD